MLGTVLDALEPALSSCPPGAYIVVQAKNKLVTYLERNTRRKSVCGGDLSINYSDRESAQKR